MKLKELSNPLPSFFENFKQFLQKKVRNEFVYSSDQSIHVYARKGIHLINGKQEQTLDIARIEVDDALQGRGIGTAMINGIHDLNPFKITYVENLLNEQLYARLKKQGWLDVNNSLPPCVYKSKE